MGLEQQEFLEKFRQLQSADQAALFANTVNAGQEVRVVTFDLSTAQLETNPKPLGFAFKSFIVLSATDSSVTLNMRLATRDTYQDKISITNLISGFKLPYPVQGAYFDWTAQSGKSITIVFFRSGEMSINRVTQSQGNTVSEGSTVTTSALVTLTAATAGAIFPVLASRNTGVAQNITGGDIWVGDSSVTNSGATTGIKFANGERIVWKNTAALYAYSVLGGDIAVMEEA